MDLGKQFLKYFFSVENIEHVIVIIAYIVLIYILLIAVVHFERRLFNKLIERREKMSGDKTNIIFLRNALIYITYCVGFLSMLNQIPGMQQFSSTLLTGAGILAAAIGFGSQQAISNIVSGIFMVLFKPFRVGDSIDLGDNKKGTVLEISLRHTTIKNKNDNIVVIPNSVLNNQSIINTSGASAVSCEYVEVGIGYDADIDRAMEIMREEAVQNKLFLDNRTESEKEKGVPQVVVRVVELGKPAIILRANVWAANSTDAFELKCALLKSIKERFDSDGIEIPYRNSAG